MKKIRNLHACLVHESLACVEDLVQNLKLLDPSSDILIYDGSGGVLSFDYNKDIFKDVLFYPSPRKQTWGNLQCYIIDCMKFLLNGDWHFMTIVDSDQLLCSDCYFESLSSIMNVYGLDNIGFIGPHVQHAIIGAPPESCAPPLQGALKHFQSHVALCSQLSSIGWKGDIIWNFNPSTVYGREAIRALIGFLSNSNLVLTEIEQAHLFAGDEIYLGTIINALGYKTIEKNYRHSVRWKKIWPNEDIKKRILDDSIWLHPIPRDISDEGRSILRSYALEVANKRLRPSSK